MRHLTACVVVLGLSGSGLAETWTVDDDGPADFNTIQAAIYAASNGDEILVSPGMYQSSPALSSIVDIVKSLTIRSTSGPEVTWINGNGSRRCVETGSAQASGSVIDGFTLYNGYTSHKGGGFYTSQGDVTVKNCHIRSCNCDVAGGGVHLHSQATNVLIENCYFSDNSAPSGGGIYAEFGGGHVFRNCFFENNSSSQGSALHFFAGNPHLDGCEFINNNSNAVFLDSSSATVTQCIFDGNQGTALLSVDNAELVSSWTITECTFSNSDGHTPLYIARSEPVISNCVFDNNTADGDAGALMLETADAVINSCTFIDNYAGWRDGGAVSIYGGSTNITGCEFITNSAFDRGGAINILGPSPVGGHADIYGCRFESNSANGTGGAIYIWTESSASVHASYFCLNEPTAISGTWSDLGGNGFYDFCDDADSDGTSDSEDNCYLYNPDQADCNENGIGDICDIADGTVEDINGNSIPDDCDCLSDIYEDGTVDVLDLLLVINFWGSNGGDADINFDGTVDVIDLLAVIDKWGPCE
jgi:hypothetical protein